jgi:hypothetical protein
VAISREDSDVAKSSLGAVDVGRLEDLIVVAACGSSSVKKPSLSRSPQLAIAVPSSHLRCRTAGYYQIVVDDDRVTEKAVPTVSDRLIDQHSTNVVIEYHIAVTILVVKTRHLAPRYRRCVRGLAAAGYTGANCAFPCSPSLASSARIGIFAVG